MEERSEMAVMPFNGVMSVLEHRLLAATAQLEELEIYPEQGVADRALLELPQLLRNKPLLVEALLSHAVEVPQIEPERTPAQIKFQLKRSLCTESEEVKYSLANMKDFVANTERTNKELVQQVEAESTNFSSTENVGREDDFAKLQTTFNQLKQDLITVLKKGWPDLENDIVTTILPGLESGKSKEDGWTELCGRPSLSAIALLHDRAIMEQHPDDPHLYRISPFLWT